MKITEIQAKEMMAEYPEIVQALTRLEFGRVYGGHCDFDGWKAHIKTSEFEYSFRHEMGHAMAFILGINESLGRLVNENQTNAITNDNPFCYGAQYNRKYGQGSTESLSEFSADALAYYYMGNLENLPDVVIEFIEKEIENAK